MSLDSKILTTRFCNDCGLIHKAGETCKMGMFYDMKIAIGKCPHCKCYYKTDTTEPVEVYIPWENRLVWQSCWKCFIEKLEG